VEVVEVRLLLVEVELQQQPLSDQQQQVVRGRQVPKLWRSFSIDVRIKRLAQEQVVSVTFT
jgi:hypothetical protein